MDSRSWWILVLGSVLNRQSYIWILVLGSVCGFSYFVLAKSRDLSKNCTNLKELEENLEILKYVCFWGLGGGIIEMLGKKIRNRLPLTITVRRVSGILRYKVSRPKMFSFGQHGTPHTIRYTTPHASSHKMSTIRSHKANEPTSETRYIEEQHYNKKENTVFYRIIC